MITAAKAPVHVGEMKNLGHIANFSVRGSIANCLVKMESATIDVDPQTPAGTRASSSTPPIYIGAIVGYANGTTVTNCIALGSEITVISSESTDNIYINRVGYNDGGVFSSNYANKDMLVRIGTSENDLVSVETVGENHGEDLTEDPLVLLNTWVLANSTPENPYRTWGSSGGAGTGEIGFGELPTHTVTYDTNGGSAVDAIQLQFGSLVTQPANPTLEGFKFIGWHKDANCTQPWDFDNDKIYGDITLYAKWEVITYIIYFECNGGSTINPIAASHGGLITKPADPTREAYTFNGWYKDDACTEFWDFDNGKVYGDMTLYAKWSDASCTVTFETLGGTSIEPLQVGYGGLVARPNNPVRESYMFNGWYKDAEYTQPWDFDNDQVYSDMTLYAKWTLLSSIYYSVTFESNQGSAVAPVQVQHGVLITQPTDPTLEGYDFLGWHKDTDCTQPWDFDNDRVYADMTLYARWEVATSIKGMDADGVEIYAIRGHVVVKNATSAVTVYNMAGAPVSVNEKPEAMEMIELQRDYYVVRCGKKMVKVVVF